MKRENNKRNEEVNRKMKQKRNNKPYAERGREGEREREE